MRFFKSVAVLFFGVFAVSTSYAGDYLFKKIADTTGDFSGFGEPSINDQREVAFFGTLDSGLRGIFRSNGHVLTTIAENGGGEYSDFDPFPVVNNAGSVVFLAELAESGFAIAVGNGMSVTDVATTTDGIGLGFATRPSINNLGEVAFATYSGVYFSDGGEPEEVVGTADGYTYFGEHDVDLNDNGKIAFLGGHEIPGDLPVHTIDLWDGDTITELAVGGGPSGVRFFALGNDDIVFFSFYTPLDGILFESDGLTTTQLAAFWEGKFSELNYSHVAIERRGILAFDAALPDHTYCLFAGVDPVESRVVCEGDVVLGKTITSLQVGRKYINDRGDLAFYAALDDGSRGIFVAMPSTMVAIDIKPGNLPNSVNPSSKQRIPVAIITTDSFDATQVNWESVSFGPGGATEVHGRPHIVDVDEDGDMDMLLHFLSQDTGIACGDTEASLSGETFVGETIAGTDTIVTVPCH